MNTLQHQIFGRRPATGSVADQLQQENNAHLLQMMQDKLLSIGSTVGAHATQLIVGLVMVVAVGLVSLTAMSLSTYDIASNINYYYPATRDLKAAILADDAPIHFTPPYNATLQCPTASGRSDLCTYFSYVNHSISVFNQFMINGTLPDFDNFTLPALGYSNGAFFMANVTNAKEAFDNLVGQAVNNAAVGAANTAAINAIDTSVNTDVGSIFYVERAAVGGADTSTCGRNPLFPCATPDFALTRIPFASSLNVSYVLQIGAGLFTVAAPLSLPCNVEVRGYGTSTLLVASSGIVLNATVSTTTCSVVLDSMRVQLGASFNLTFAAPLTSDLLTLRNITFVSSASNVYINGVASSLGTLILDHVYAAGGIGTMYVSDMNVFGDVVQLVAPLSIAYSTLGGLVDLRQFTIGTGFTLSTAAASVSTALRGYGWANPAGANWTIATATGSTTVFRGDLAAIGLINTGSVYGPLSSGGGTLTLVRETGASGLAYTATTPSTWAVSGVPVQANDALDKLSSRMFSIENTAGRDITFFDNIGGGSAGASCPAAFPTLVNLGSAGTAVEYVSGINYFNKSSSSFFFLEYVGVSAARFRVSMILHATISYGSSAESYAGMGMCLRGLGPADCLGDWPRMAFSVRPTAAAGVDWSATLERTYTFSPGQTFTPYVFVELTGITDCNLFPDLITFEFLHF